MNPIESIIKWYIGNKAKDVLNCRTHAVELQNKVFLNLIEKGKNTDYGKRHNFAAIRKPSNYFNAAPVNDYDAIKEDVQKMMEGSQNVLWPTTVKWFAKSSGTTSDKSKFIPVSPEALDDNHFKGGQDLLGMYAYNNPKTKIFNGKILAMGGSQTIVPINKNARFGDISAVMLSNTPPIGNYLRAPEKTIALLPDWEEKLQRIVETTINQDIHGMAGVPTWSVVLIQQLFEKTGKNNLLDIWPNMELYVHGGVSFVPYHEKFKQLIPHESMNYLQTYNASEGFFAFQDELHADDMLLAVDHGIFYEFIPSGEWDNAFPTSIPLSDVEIGKNYALVITTNAGLWRYKIGDTIQFTNKNPYRIKVSGRTKHFINVFGEEVIVDNTDQAIAKACLQTNAIVVDYTVAPIFFEGNEKGGHEWLIEFERQPDDFEKFKEFLDITLQNINSDYEAKRFKNFALNFPIIHNVRPRLFNDWLQSKGKLGGQHKIPRLSNERNYLEELLKLNKTN
jgi:hypothetical protein